MWKDSAKTKKHTKRRPLFYKRIKNIKNDKEFKHQLRNYDDDRFENSEDHIDIKKIQNQTLGKKTRPNTAFSVL